MADKKLRKTLSGKTKKQGEEGLLNGERNITRVLETVLTKKEGKKRRIL